MGIDRSFWQRRADRVAASAAEFVAPRLLRNAHVQTLGAALPLWAPPRSFADVALEALRVRIPGGLLHGDAWWHERGDRLAVVVLHGVGGSSSSRYAVRAAVALYRAGHHVVRLNLRGAGDSVIDAPQLYHAGLTEDPRAAIEAIAARERVRGVALLGFSLGGNVALKLAGEWRDAPPPHVRAVASISAPLDLVDVSRAMERARNLPYRRYVLRGLVAQGRAFAALHPSRATYDVRRLARLRTIRAYDEEVIVPMHGFADAHDYYVRASAGPTLADVRVPTLIVHAEDDPMVPDETVRPWLRNASRAVRAVWSRRGGHVGWFGGFTESAWVKTWAIDRVLEHLRAHA